MINAYLPGVGGGGGFRNWWRSLYGSEDKLDKEHLMRMAGRFSRRLRGWAQANGIGVIDCDRGEKKHLTAEEYLAEHKVGRGLFLVLVGRAPGPVWEVQKTREGKIGNIQRKEPWPYVNHYYFHISLLITMFQKNMGGIPNHRRAQATRSSTSTSKPLAARPSGSR